jgi:hypothetical protein
MSPDPAQNPHSAPPLHPEPTRRLVTIHLDVVDSRGVSTGQTIADLRDGVEGAAAALGIAVHRTIVYADVVEPLA